MAQKSKFSKAIQWIADEDEPNDLDLEVIGNYVTTALIADVFEKTPKEIAILVRKRRMKDQALTKRRK